MVRKTVFPRVMAVAFLFAALISCFSAGAAKGSKPCWLNLVVSNSDSVAEQNVSEKSSSKNSQFLYFVRDLQNVGFHFRELSAEAVRTTFEKQSKENLKELIKNYDRWLESRGFTPVAVSPKERNFVYWKDHFSPSGGRKHVPLKTDHELKKHPEEWRSISIWSTAVDGFHGVGFNFEEMKELPAEFVASTQGNGIARVALLEQPEWSYVLPLPGTPSGDTSYSGIDTRFFAFLSVFAPETLNTFSKRLEPLVPGLKNPMELLSPGVLRSIADLQHSATAMDFIRGLREELRFLMLTPEDAADLLAYVSTQREALNPRDPRFTGGSYGALSSLTAMVSGQVGPEDYVLKERPFVPPFVGPGGVSGWKMRPGAKGVPNMTGDNTIVPDGPQIY